MSDKVERKFKLPSINFRQITPISYAFIVLCSVIGLCMGLAFSWSMPLLLLLGFIAGTLPVILPQQWSRFDNTKLSEQVSLGLLIVIAIGVCTRALVPILTDGTVRVEAAVPLLLVTPPLYLIYVILNNNSGIKNTSSVTTRLATIFSGPPIAMSLTMGITIATYCLLIIHYMQSNYPALSWFADKFLERGIIPPLTLMLFFWGILLFINKSWMLRSEAALLNNPERSAESTLMTAYQQLSAGGDEDASEHFIETVWKKSLDSYNIPRYINWALPILGFIGTVLGISLAADGIQNIVSNQSSLSQFSGELGQAIAPLGIAFDTTLIALSLSVFLMWLQTMLQRWEDSLLIDFENLIRRRTN